MKSFCFLLVLAVCVINGLSQVSEVRAKCKAGESEGDCVKRVLEIFDNQCVRIIAGDFVTVQQCGTIHCGDNLRPIEGDDSKPYPYCCPTCEIIDKDKPYVIARTG
ncbi:hypothetical protein TKK_0009066 [Trichogramma kaykai]|uniref:Single domain-containing protein n=1 Tax=Trichogramma kaykai TaxID=54128 RepID=A0ABD2X370_9HYME